MCFGFHSLPSSSSGFSHFLAHNRLLSHCSITCAPGLKHPDPNHFSPNCQMPSTSCNSPWCLLRALDTRHDSRPAGPFPPQLPGPNFFWLTSYFFGSPFSVCFSGCPSPLQPPHPPQTLCAQPHPTASITTQTLRHLQPSPFLSSNHFKSISTRSSTAVSCATSLKLTSLPMTAAQPQTLLFWNSPT